jgi:hypothetical protein
MAATSAARVARWGLAGDQIAVIAETAEMESPIGFPMGLFCDCQQGSPSEPMMTTN